MGIARGWEKRVIRTNITYAKRTVRIFSVSPQSHSPFSASFQTFCLTARTYLNTQKYGLFCSLEARGNEKFSAIFGRFTTTTAEYTNMGNYVFRSCCLTINRRGFKLGRAEVNRKRKIYTTVCTLEQNISRVKDSQISSR